MPECFILPAPLLFFCSLSAFHILCGLYRQTTPIDEKEIFSSILFSRPPSAPMPWKSALFISGPDHLGEPGIRGIFQVILPQACINLSRGLNFVQKMLKARTLCLYLIYPSQTALMQNGYILKVIPLQVNLRIIVIDGNAWLTWNCRSEKLTDAASTRLYGLSSHPISLEKINPFPEFPHHLIVLSPVHMQEQEIYKTQWNYRTNFGT